MAPPPSYAAALLNERPLPAGATVLWRTVERELLVTQAITAMRLIDARKLHMVMCGAQKDPEYGE